MGAAHTEIDAWLRGGGVVVAASERAARSIAGVYHSARQAEGLIAWPAPNIQDWKSFVCAAWEERSNNGEGDGRLLLNPLQEQALWAGIAGRGGHLATLLEGPRHRLAGLALEAHALLCAYAPRYLHSQARIGWQEDAAAFSNWLAAFDEACRAGDLLSSSRLPHELIPLLEKSPSGTGRVARPPLLLAGFDRLLPVQRSLFDAWGAWQEAGLDEQSEEIHFNEALETQEELAVCARWCSRRLAANPHSRLLVVTQEASKLRGVIERAFLQHTGSALLFEFSLGIPLTQVALARGAHLLLQWLTGPLGEHELDWLFSTVLIASSLQESYALQEAMRGLRQRGQQRPDWTLRAILKQKLAADLLPAPWVNRMSDSASRLVQFARRPRSPLEWAELVPQLLQSAGWPGERSLSSAEFQAAQRWHQAVEMAGSLGFDGRRISWADFLSILSHILDETLFTPESRGAPILIAGPAESAGLTADAIWFLGADEDAWPAGGATHPLLPLQVQREAGMPHATPQLDWDLAEAMTTRLLASAPEVHFSFARQKEGTEVRPSPLITHLAGTAHALPPELNAPLSPSLLTVVSEDRSRIPFPPGKVEGGSSVLTAQSQCPFKAFASARLAARGWELAEAGLTAAQRGQLLHAVLHAVWGGPPDGIRSLRDLQSLKDKQSFVAGRVRSVLGEEIPTGIRERMPRRYLELEEERLSRLVTEWLEYEATRMDFEVSETEAERTIHLAGLTFDVRLDRIDRLNDNSLLVIDYKSGDVTPKSWDLPRPDDVQLPLYAGFALDHEKEELGGMVFAKVRAGEYEFVGRVGNAKTTLLANLSGSNGLVKNSLTAELLIDWREAIEKLAHDFLAGDAAVDPREYPKTCERCGLQTLCRVQEPENRAQLEFEEGSESEDTADA
jgi:probable DNA repair protein